MSCPAAFVSCPHSNTDAAPGRPALAKRTGALIRRAWHAYWDWRARRATILLLNALDQRILHDIGIASSEIESLVYGACDRCRRYDASWRLRP